jgi:CRISPR system Cascade subunit CasE
MPYLSKIRINPRRPSAMRLLASPYRLHGAVQAGCPDPDQRVLWRLDADNPHRPHLLVLTEKHRPDWSHLVEQAGWPAADGDHFLIRDYTPLLDRLATGQEYAFRLRANPVQNTKRPDKPTSAQEKRLKEAERSGSRMRSFRINHRTAHAQHDWFLRRAGKPDSGFTIPTIQPPTTPAPGLEPPADARPVPDCSLTRRDTVRFRKQKDGPQITLTTATFEGRLRVTDPEALRTLLLAGIGPSKSYGCGLLTLAPLTKEPTTHG